MHRPFAPGFFLSQKQVTPGEEAAAQPPVLASRGGNPLAGLFKSLSA